MLTEHLRYRVPEEIISSCVSSRQIYTCPEQDFFFNVEDTIILFMILVSTFALAASKPKAQCYGLLFATKQNLSTGLNFVNRLELKLPFSFTKFSVIYF